MTDRARPDGSLTLDNASVQRLLDYGLLHHTKQGWIVGQWADAVKAEQSLTPPVTADTVFEAIKHGDDEHRAWLREACDNLFAGKPAPPPRGTNSLTPPEDDTVSEAIEPLLRFHETGGHEGDGSDERLALIRAALQSPTISDTAGIENALWEYLALLGRRLPDGGIAVHSVVHVPSLARAVIAALQSRVSPQAGMRGALEPFVERLEMLEDNCRKLGCGVPSETNVRTSWLRKLRAALSTYPIPVSEDAK